MYQSHLQAWPRVMAVNLKSMYDKGTAYLISSLKMQEEITDRVPVWQKKLILVLELIKTNPESIIDDTSIEKLLSWLTETAADENQRSHLLHPSTNILGFLSSSPDSLLSNASCASFSLKLAGILAQCDETVCKMLIECGSLQNLFEKFQSIDSLRNAVVKCAFFEGLSAVVSSCTGLLWCASLPGLIQYAIHSFSDASFYVIKSAISFLKAVLLSTIKYGINTKALEIRAETLHIISREYLNCKMDVRTNYLNLLCQLFDFSPALSWELLTAFGGLATLVHGIHGKPVRLLQSISEVCHQSIQNGRAVADILSEGTEDSFHICREVLKVTIEIAKIDIIYLCQHLSSIVYSSGTSEIMNVPEYWNKLIITIVLWGLIGQQNGSFGDSLSFDKTLIPAIEKNAMPEDVALLFHELESIVYDKLKNAAIWKKCLTFAMDAYKQFFAKNYIEALGVEGTYLIQCWSLFLCEMLVVISRDKKSIPPCDELLSCISGQKYLTNKCITIIKEIIQNKWFEEFSIYAKMRIISSLIQGLNDQTADTKMLSSIIQLFGSLIDFLTDDLREAMFASRDTFNPQSLTFDESLQYQFVEEFLSSCNELPDLFEKLLLDSRWEIKDSVLELVSSMVIYSTGSSVMEEFLERETFWLKSWSLLDADESYIRSASVRLIGLVYENRKLRDILLSSLSLEKVLSKLLRIFQEDDEAFPKRSIVDALCRWIDLNELVHFVLKYGACEKYDDMNFQDAKVWNFIFEVLRTASVNFDWEVKRKGILCWAKILMIGSSGEGNLAGSQKMDEQKYNCLEMVCKRQGSSILVSALNDCDKLVCESAFHTLKWIRNNVGKRRNGTVEMDITSVEDTMNISSSDFSSIDAFLAFIDRIEFVELEDSIKLADCDVINNPVSLLSDIIAASEANDDNLLDCY